MYVKAGTVKSAVEWRQDHAKAPSISIEFHQRCGTLTWARHTGHACDDASWPCSAVDCKHVPQNEWLHDRVTNRISGTFDLKQIGQNSRSPGFTGCSTGAAAAGACWPASNTEVIQGGVPELGPPATCLRPRLGTLQLLVTHFDSDIKI
jgi:hypothetical protein